MLNFDFTALREGKITFADVVKDVKYSDLRAQTDEFFNTIQSIIAGTTDADVTFLPQDPETQEANGLGWPMSHIIVHLTATIEESAAVAAMLARGVTVEGRLRYETPWESIQTAAQLQARLKESQRMCHAFLDAWPDAPHLDVTIIRVPALGPLNAIAMYMLGIFHGQTHFNQLRNTVQQAKQVSHT